MIINNNAMSGSVSSLEELITSSTNPVINGWVKSGYAISTNGTTPTLDTGAYSKCFLSTSDVTAAEATAFGAATPSIESGVFVYMGKNIISGQSTIDASAAVSGKTYYGTKCARFILGTCRLTDSSTLSIATVGVTASTIHAIIYRAATSTIETVNTDLAGYTATMSGSTSTDRCAYYYLDIAKATDDIILYLNCRATVL